MSAQAVTSVRCLALIMLAAGVEAYLGRLEGIDELGGTVTLSMAATVLMVLPLFALQVGVARTPPLTAHHQIAGAGLRCSPCSRSTAG